MSENKEIKKGGISVETEHIFPIIKRWLYSEKDIFLREIVSNATDAITKHKRLVSLGQTGGDDIPYRVVVTVDKSAGTLTVEDNGIGMSSEELEKYICSIALSGALDFIQKYENESDVAKSGIIGHFGLGFYSSFMVSDKVEIFTKSYGDAPAVHWICNEAGEYEIDDCDRETRGTAVVMHINEGEEYLDIAKIREILKKYCSFMPEEIYLYDADADAEKDKKGEKSDNAENTESKEDTAEKPVNDTQPLWLKPASDCTPEEYKEFYHKVFADPRDPLFWIHINADYPLNFKGILYFPRINNEYESIQGQVQLYYNQVFVANNIKEVIPEYLLMLKGVLDCPELPLNVSRSYLQTNTYVSKVSGHIVKKVADKLNSLLANDREQYEHVWEDIRTFIEYACLCDRKFYDRVKDSLLLHLTDGKFVTIPEYLEAAKETNDKKVYYTSDMSLQAQYISMLDGAGIKVALMEHIIDTQFVSLLEEQLGDGIKFLRVDSDISTALGNGDAVTDDEGLKTLFVKVSGNDNLKVEFSNLKDTKIPAVLKISEDSRRFGDMMKMYSAAGKSESFDYPVETTLVVNNSAPLTQKLSSLVGSDGEKAEKIASYIYKLSLLSQKRLTADEMQKFLSDGFDLLELI